MSYTEPTPWSYYDYVIHASKQELVTLRDALQRDRSSDAETLLVDIENALETTR